jgi:hypothetical protein
LDVRDLTRAEIEAREAIMITVRYLKENHPGFEQAFLLETAPQLGVRESRLLLGEYTLTHDDIQQQATFDDVVAHAGILFKDEGKGFDIPYRCLVPEEMGALIVAGRCISTDHSAQDHIRVIPPCFALGHAAGVAAGLAVRAGVQPKTLAVASVQEQLIKEGAYLGAKH